MYCDKIEKKKKRRDQETDGTTLGTVTRIFVEIAFGKILTIIRLNSYM